jgi:hypothetical protein
MVYIDPPYGVKLGSRSPGLGGFSGDTCGIHPDKVAHIGLTSS